MNAAQVTTLLPKDAKGAIARTKAGDIDYSKDFFGKPTMLTVSGQVRTSQSVQPIFIEPMILPARSTPPRPAAASGGLRHGAVGRVHVRAHVPRGGEPHVAPPRRVLDDRAGDRLRGHRGAARPRRGLPQ